MPKVLFLGCNTDQLPYLRAAQAMGFTVIGTDMNANAPGAVLADRFYCVSYTDIDGLLQVAKVEGCGQEDRVFTAAAHFAYEGAAHLAAALDIPFIGSDVVDVCLNKTRFYALLRELDVHIPAVCLFDSDSAGVPDPDKIYFLKSDYGKSPHYCYRIVNGQIPPLPRAFDSFYRHNFLLQEEVEGTHFRLNLYAEQAALFLKFSDMVAVPMRVVGPSHAEVLNKLRGVVSALGIGKTLTKFDLIVNKEGWYVIDIGLDPPLRLKLLCEYLGFDFPAAYTRYYLLGDAAAIPAWVDICKPVIIQGSFQHGFTFTLIGNEA
jgi:hypothetical protein